MTPEMLAVLVDDMMMMMRRSMAKRVVSVVPRMREL